MMISVYALVKSESKVQLTGAWRGEEKTAPEGCLTMETRNGPVETHYWVMDGDITPPIGKECMCGKEEYYEE